MAGAEELTLPERLKRVRKHAGLSEAALAAACNMLVGSYLNYEAGKAKPPQERLYGMARGLGLRTDALMFALGYPGFEHAEGEFEAWWQDTMLRRYTLQAAGFRTSVKHSASARVNETPDSLTTGTLPSDARLTPGNRGVALLDRPHSGH